MSFEFDAGAADATPEATERDVIEELRRRDSEFVQVWETVLEPSLRMRLNSGSWPEHRRAHLVRCAYRAYNEQRAEIEREGRGGFKLDEREALALAQLRDAATLPERRLVLSKFGLVGGSQRLPADSPIVTPMRGAWARLPVGTPRDRTDVFWRFCADRRFPQYEVLTREFLAALGAALAAHISLFVAAALLPPHSADTATVVEVGAGSGRLAHFLSAELAAREAQLPGRVRVRVVATDDMSERVPVQFPVERCSAQQAVERMSPLIVIAQWMPLGEDWTECFRKCPTLQEYLLIGPPEVTGHVSKTWAVRHSHTVLSPQQSHGCVGCVSPKQDFEGWERTELPEVGMWQICRCDSRDSIGHSTTTCFRRTHGLKAGQLEAVVAAKAAGNEHFRHSSFAQCVLSLPERILW